MHMNKYEELRENTESIGVTNQFEVRTFKASGNFLIIDEDGDFIIIDRDHAEFVGSCILTHLMQTKEIIPS